MRSRYIELNPVNANMVQHPSEHRWSSYMCNAYGRLNRLITPHSIYNNLGATKGSRQEAYALLFKHCLEECDVKVIRNAARFSMPTGDSRFQKQIEQALQRKIGHAYRGRPRTSDVS